MFLKQVKSVRIFNKYNVQTIHVKQHYVQTYLMLYVYHQVVVNVQLISLTLLVIMSQIVAVSTNNLKMTASA